MHFLQYAAAAFPQMPPGVVHALGRLPDIVLQAGLVCDMAACRRARSLYAGAALPGMSSCSVSSHQKLPATLLVTCRLTQSLHGAGVTPHCHLLLTQCDCHTQPANLVES